MTFPLKKIFFLGLFTFAGGVLFLTVSHAFVKTTYETTTFLTVLSADPDSSVSEKESASSFLVETIIGWTRSPSFQEQVIKDETGISISAKKQERQNLVLIAQSTTEKASKNASSRFHKVLEEELEQYNTLSNTAFTIRSWSPKTVAKKANKVFAFVGGSVLGFFGWFVAMEILFWFTASRKQKRK